MDQILAREPEEELGDKDDPDNSYGEKLLEQLREIIRRNKKKNFAYSQLMTSEQC